MSEREMVRRATVAKVLRERRPGDPLNEYIQDARAILEALDGQGESMPTGEFSGELVEGEASVMDAGQQIRAAIADRLLADEGLWARDVDDPGELGRIVVECAAPIAAWVETGAEPLLSQGSAAVAEGRS